MLLTALNLSNIEYKTKRVKLKKADVEFNVALIPVSLIEETKNSDDPSASGLKILMASVVDDAGNPVFTTVESFESLPPSVQVEIMDSVWEYNGLGGGLEKNLGTTPANSSSSD